jgi:signal transduction histidine kinase
MKRVRDQLERWAARLFGPENPRPLPLGEASYRERVLARGRLALSLVLLAIIASETTASSYAVAATLTFTVYSAAILIVLESQRGRLLSVHSVVHYIDVLWTLLFPMVAEEFEATFVLTVLFVLLSAVARSGARATTRTTALISAGLAFQRLTAGWVWLPHVHRYRLGYHGVVEVVEVLVLGNLIAFFGDQEQKLRTESSLIAHIIGRARQETGFNGMLQAIFRELVDFFEGHEALFVLREESTASGYIWHLRRRPRSGHDLFEFHELSAADEPVYFFPCPPAIQVERRLGSGMVVDGLGERGERLRRLDDPLPSRFHERYLFRSLGCVSNSVSDWSGRFFLLSETRSMCREAELRSLQTLMNQVGPAIHNTYLVRKLRTRAGALERARVARELHDGVIQSLYGLEMEVDVLKRNSHGRKVAADLGRIQDRLRHEAITLRELMEHMKPLDLGPHQFVDFVATSMAKFQRETGISATFVTELQEVPLSAHACRELGRIVQEALVNVRRHSRAKNVLVRLDRDGHVLKLVIDDDGRGFASFSGRFTHDELEHQRLGPTVIKERLRSIGARLFIETHPDQGSRLEVEIPHS